MCESETLCEIISNEIGQDVGRCSKLKRFVTDVLESRNGYARLVNYILIAHGHYLRNGNLDFCGTLETILLNEGGELCEMELEMTRGNLLVGPGNEKDIMNYAMRLQYKDSCFERDPLQEIIKPKNALDALRLLELFGIVRKNDFVFSYEKERRDLFRLFCAVGDLERAKRRGNHFLILREACRDVFCVSDDLDSIRVRPRFQEERYKMLEHLFIRRDQLHTPRSESILNSRSEYLFVHAMSDIDEKWENREMNYHEYNKRLSDLLELGESAGASEGKELEPHNTQTIEPDALLILVGACKEYYDFFDTKTREEVLDGIADAIEDPPFDVEFFKTGHPRALSTLLIDMGAIPEYRRYFHVLLQYMNDCHIGECPDVHRMLYHFYERFPDEASILKARHHKEMYCKRFPEMGYIMLPKDHAYHKWSNTPVANDRTGYLYELLINQRNDLMASYIAEHPNLTITERIEVLLGWLVGREYEEVPLTLRHLGDLMVKFGDLKEARGYYLQSSNAGSWYSEVMVRLLNPTIMEEKSHEQFFHTSSPNNERINDLVSRVL